MGNRVVAGGVVYYANYLKFLERARTEALFTIGFNNKKIKENYGALIVVKSCNIEYKKPSYLEDELKIRSFVKSATKTSFFMSQFISRDDDLIVDVPYVAFFKNVRSMMALMAYFTIAMIIVFYDPILSHRLVILGIEEESAGIAFSLMTLVFAISAS